jgi:hypothetical protein
MRLPLLVLLALLPSSLSADTIEVRYATFFGSDEAAPKVLDLMTSEQLGMLLIPPTPIPPNGLMKGEQTKEAVFASTFDENGNPKTTLTRKIGPSIEMTVKPDGKGGFTVDATLKEIVRSGERVTLVPPGKAALMPILENSAFEAKGIACQPGQWALYTTKDGAGSKWMALAIRIGKPAA